MESSGVEWEDKSPWLASLGSPVSSPNFIISLKTPFLSHLQNVNLNVLAHSFKTNISANIHI